MMLPLPCKLAVVNTFLGLLKTAGYDVELRCSGCLTLLRTVTLVLARLPTQPKACSRAATVASRGCIRITV